jgi:hypothetical protein
MLWRDPLPRSSGDDVVNFRLRRQSTEANGHRAIIQPSAFTSSHRKVALNMKLRFGDFPLGLFVATVLAAIAVLLSFRSFGGLKLFGRHRRMRVRGTLHQSEE